MEIPSILTVERLGVFEFFSKASSDLLDGFSIGKVLQEAWIFLGELSAHGLKAERCGFLVENRSEAGAIQKIDSIHVLLLRGKVNSELKIDQNTTSETKGRLFTVGKVTKRLFSIDPCTYLAINAYRWSK